MKKRKLLFLLPLTSLLLGGCDLPPALENAKDWINNSIVDPIKDLIPGQKEEEEQPSGEKEEEAKKDFEGLSLSNLSVVYDGGAHKIELVGELPEGATVSYGEKGNEFTEVGVYEIVANVKCEGYNDLSLTATLNIIAADFTGLSMSDATVTYDGLAHKIEVEGELPQGATVYYGEQGNLFTNAGTYEIHATVRATGYNDLSLSAKLTIEKADFEGIVFENAIVTYDGEAHGLEAVVPEKYEGATVVYGENSFTSVGNHTVTVTVSLENYNDFHGQAILTIAEAVFDGLSFSNREVTYNGEKQTIELAGETPEGTVVSYVEGFDGATLPGVYTVKVIVSLEGYQSLELEATLTINPAQFEGISFEDRQETYTGEAFKLEPNVPEMYEGAEISYGEGGNSFIEVGEYEVEVTVSLLGYESYQGQATLTIVPAAFEGVSMSDLEVTYDGLEHSINVVGAPEFAEVTYGENGHAFTAAGEYAITATVSAHGYTTLELSATLKIDKANFEGIEFADASLPYDGETHSVAPEVPAMYEGAEISYGEGGNEFAAVGEYDISCVVSLANYNDYQGQAHLSIYAPGAASENLMVSDFEALDDNDLIDDYELLWYGSAGWQVPSSATISIANNQFIGSGSKTVKMKLTHQGSPFKVTKALGSDKTFKNYEGFAIDTFVDDHVEGGATTLMVQFWFKDLPLPEGYEGYANTYATYTLSQDAQKGWAHWEIPFTDDTLRIAGSDQITAAFNQLGYSVADFSMYIDAVAFLANPNYVDGKNVDVYYDNLELLASAPSIRSEVRFLEGGRYANAGEEHYYALDLASDLHSATYNVDGQVVSALSAEKTATGFVFKDTQAAGAGLTVNAKIMHSGIEVESVSGMVAEQFAYLEGMRFVRHANLNMDFSEETIQTTYVNSEWTQEYYGSAWTKTSGQMRVRGTAEDPHLNVYCGDKTTYRYTFTSNKLSGLANKFSIDIANYFNGSSDIEYKIKLVKANGADKWIVGDSSNFEILPAATAQWLHISQEFEPEEFKSFVLVAKGTASGGQYFYFDNVKLEYAMPEVTPPEPPVEIHTLTDGTFYIWNSASDAYRLDISDNLTSATVTKYGSEDTYPMSVAVSNNEITIADTMAAGQGLTIVGEIDADEQFVINSVTGQMASAFSGSLLTKTAKKCADVSLDFADGTQDATYTNANWKESKYQNSGWTEYATPTDMRCKVDKNGNKVVNFHCGTGAKNFRYVQDLPIGPVNHLEVDLGNYWSSSAGTLRYKISLLDENDQVKRYVAGDGSNWATLDKDTSQGSLCVKQEFDFDLTFAKRIRITTSMASGEAYLYMDNLKVSYKAPEPVTPPEPQTNYTLADGSYYVWNGSSDAFRMEISNSQTTATVQKLGGSVNNLTVTVSGDTVTFKDVAYSGVGLTIVAELTANNAMTITEVSGQAASIYSGSLLNKNVKHCADVSIDFSDGTAGQKYSNSHWTSQQYTDKWSDMTPDMNSRTDASGNKVVNLVSGGYTRNFIYTPDETMGPVNHIEFDMANYFGSSAGDIQVKVCVIDAGGNKFYALGDASNFVTIAKDTSQGSVLVHYDLPINLCVGAKLQITTKCSAGTSYLYVDNFHIYYAA